MFDRYISCFAFGFGCLLFTCVLLFALPEVCSAKLDGLVAAWLLDEGAGNMAEDASGNGHDGEIRNAKWVEGKFGEALEFGPSDSVVVIPHSDDFTIEVFTVTGWVKCGIQGHWQTIVTKTGENEGAQPRNYGTFVRPNHGGIHFSLQGGNTKINSEEKVTDEEWHYVVMTRSEDGTLRGYIDGIKVVEDGSSEPGVNDEDVSIGAGGGGVRYWMIGSVDEVAIFDRALSEG
jgi:WD40 repeat protein